jgi:hypothetical protein
VFDLFLEFGRRSVVIDMMTQLVENVIFELRLGIHQPD